MLKWNIKCPDINKDSVSYEERRRFDKCQISINTIKQYMTEMMSVHNDIPTKYNAIKAIYGSEDNFVKDYLLQDYIKGESLDKKNSEKIGVFSTFQSRCSKEAIN